ncbi:MAG: 3-hydroxyacyl-ACP dehydratase FabZ [Xanthomonadaceae bacterium]|jgi:3-hydroxyacyl-[acyl-carrier-protein] dehydratase|nr:3-hydroxyacyl-ACP dehydratase FabZ [Xanthomonadaceae bacterium]
MTHSPTLPIEAEQIQSMIMHRYPFLMVDRIIEFEPGKRILAYKNVTINEPFFQGHFPGHPVMPGVLILEALAQVGGLLTLIGREEGSNNRFYLAKIDNARFSRMVIPGDRLDLEVTLRRVIRGMGFYTGAARVDGEIVACADLVCAEVKD